MEDYHKEDPDMQKTKYKFGIIYIREKDEFEMQDINDAFDYIPDETNTEVVYSNEPISIGVKSVKNRVN